MIAGSADHVEQYEDSSIEASVARVEALAPLMDSAFLIPGTNIRFGLDAIIGLVPAVGDFILQIISSYIIWEARRLGASYFAMRRMIGNSLLDIVVGSSPVAGDAFDFAFRANIKNLTILKTHLAKRGYVVKSVAGPVIQGQSIRV